MMMNTRMSAKLAPWSFFLLVYVLSIPFLLIDPIAERFLPKDIPINLPVSALVFVTPLTAASILTYRESGPGGVKLLLQRAFDYKKIRKKIWYIPILGIMPVTYLLAYGFMRLSPHIYNTVEEMQLVARVLAGRN